MPLAYNEIRSRAGAFHKNFSRGDFDANGPLVARDIDVNSNNTLLKGSEAFVDRIKRFSVPFPGLQLRDHVLIVDGHDVAVLYYMQGMHLGPLGPLEASGNRIEALGGELFAFDEHGLMRKLITVTRLDHIVLQAKGTRSIKAHRIVELAEPVAVDIATTQRLREIAAGLHDRLAAGDYRAIDPEILVNVDGSHERGAQTLVRYYDMLHSAFSDLSIEPETVLVDGDRAAIGYHLSGTHTGEWRHSGGELFVASRRPVRLRALDFVRFSPDGQLTEYVTVINTDEIAAQLRAG